MIFSSVQFNVTTPVTIRCRIGDILSVLRPANTVATPLHQLEEVFTVTGHSHAFINADLQIHLPAVALVIGTVLPVIHPMLFLFLLGLNHREAVLHTQPVRRSTESVQRFQIAVILLSGFLVDRVDYEVGMDMHSVCVRSNHDLMVRNFFRQLQCNLMGDLRRQLFAWMEGLDHMIVHPSIRILMESLGVHELLQRKLWNAIDTADQLSALVFGFEFLTAVVDHTVQSTNGL